jgi:hypothetical protein
MLKALRDAAPQRKTISGNAFGGNIPGWRADTANAHGALRAGIPRSAALVFASCRR